MVPQLVGYIDKAKDKQYQVRARNIMIAAQTVLDEKYATEKAGAGYDFGTATTAADDMKKILVLAEEIEEGEDPTAKSTAIITAIKALKNYKITDMTIDFKEAAGGATAKTAEYKNKVWEIKDPATTSPSPSPEPEA